MYGFLALKSLVGLVLYGTVITGFISRMENMEFKSGNALLDGQKQLKTFRQLKKGFGPYLFVLFSVHTLALVAIVFLLIEYWKLGFDTIDGIEFTFLTFFTGLPLLYTVLVAKDAYSTFQNISPILRYRKKL